MLKAKNKIFIIAGTAGSGKGSVWAPLIEKPDKYHIVKSCTTRAKRSNSKDENKYEFLTEEKFEELVERGEFIEHETVHDCSYGTLKSEIERGLKSQKTVIMELDVNGALRLKSIYDNVVLIFVQPSNIEEAKERLRKRKTEDKKAVELRISRYDMELSKSKEFDRIIINDDLGVAQEDLLKIIRTEREL